MIRRIHRLLRRLMRGNPFVRLLVAIFVLWVAAAVFLRFTEGMSNDEFGSMSKAMWNIAVYLFSGMDSGEPQTGAGKCGVVFVLVLSAGVVAVFTGEIASFLVENRLGSKRKMPAYSLKGHFVICNWNDKAVPIIRELHADVVKDKRPIVVISEAVDAAELPDEDDDPSFQEVYLIKGDPANETILRRANAGQAHSVIVLADPADAELADAKSILIAMAARAVCAGADGPGPHVCVEGVSPQNVGHLRRAGADEIVSASDFGMMLLAQTALNHGLGRVYRDLLRESDDTNEVYTVPVPEAFIGKTFEELGAAMFANRKGNDNPAILIGVRTADGFEVNPRGEQSRRMMAGDEAVVIAFERPDSLV
ncbi:MAG: NAD-binding protein [Candidatus Hydrogenedentes bacterium]|nr:NAD-binding protein [Candidatus Hydrogenedentota bacterium]